MNNVGNIYLHSEYNICVYEYVIILVDSPGINCKMLNEIIMTWECGDAFYQNLKNLSRNIYKYIFPQHLVVKHIEIFSESC